jgi:hypothetical protein
VVVLGFFRVLGLVLSQRSAGRQKQSPSARP